MDFRYYLNLLFIVKYEIFYVLGFSVGFFVFYRNEYGVLYMLREKYGLFLYNEKYGLY